MNDSPGPGDADAADRPFDSGLQAERTALAWRRTGLSFALGSLVAARIMTPVLGLAAFALAAVGLAAAVVLMAAGDRRYRSAHRALTAGGAHPVLPTDARLALLLTVCVVGAGGIAVWYVVSV